MQQILANRETALPIREAFAEVLGMVPDRQAMRRWYTKGTRGTKLEVVLVGGRVHTSAEAVRRFVSESSLPAKRVKR